MAASLAPKGCPYDVDLVWCYPTPDAAPFLGELNELTVTRPHLRVHARCDLDHPLPTAQTLAELCVESPGSPLWVADLVRQAKSNADVAAELLMGVETVKTHLSRVYAKLGVANRTQLTALKASG